MSILFPDQATGPDAPAASPHVDLRIVGATWIVVLAFSDLPEILLRAASIQAPADLVWWKVGSLGLFLLLCRAIRALRPLTPFAAVMLVFSLALRGSDALGSTAWWQELWAGGKGSFALAYLDLHLRDLGVALVVLVALWLLLGHRRRFFLTRGDLGASVAPVRWLGIGEGGRWRSFVWIFGGVAAFLVLVVTLMGIRFEPGDFGRLLRHAPTVFLLAATNAFAEEAYFRLSLLGTLPGVVGRSHAQAMNVVLFGLAHWLTGSPPGLPGALMTGFLAWAMGKCVLETRGLLGAWIIHLLPDLVIFATYALFWKGGL